MVRLSLGCAGAKSSSILVDQRVIDGLKAQLQRAA